jgi:predicted negative regulator of RcsB-dependent stress response
MSKLMQNILIIFGILIIGVVMGWNWHKSTIKPIII